MSLLSLCTRTHLPSQIKKRCLCLGKDQILQGPYFSCVFGASPLVRSRPPGHMGQYHLVHLKSCVSQVEWQHQSRQEQGNGVQCVDCYLNVSVCIRQVSSLLQNFWNSKGNFSLFYFRLIQQPLALFCSIYTQVCDFLSHVCMHGWQGTVGASAIALLRWPRLAGGSVWVSESPTSSLLAQGEDVSNPQLLHGVYAFCQLFYCQ